MRFRVEPISGKQSLLIALLAGGDFPNSEIETSETTTDKQTQTEARQSPFE